MIELYIDNTRMEVPEETELKISVSEEQLRAPSQTEEVQYPIRIPMTPANRLALGHTEQVLSIPLFNHKKHPAKVTAAGATLVLGYAQLLDCETDAEGTGWYRISLIVPRPLWIDDTSEALMRELDSDYEEVISGEMVEASWASDSLVKFFPVQRDRYDQAESDTEVPPTRILTYEDYHPFFHIKTLLERIATRSGYRIASEFMDSDYFRSLYMSGYYPSKNIELIKSRMNFLSGRFETASATANDYGTIFTTPYVPSNTLGNLVDTADPYEMKNGKRIEGAFNNGGCFKKTDLRPAFVPSQDVVAGFEYRLRFRSNFRVVSQTRMKGFTQIRLEDGATHEFGQVNKLKNQKNGTDRTGEFSVVIFGFDPQTSYRLTLYYTDSTSVQVVVVTAESQITTGKILDHAVLEGRTGSGNYSEVTDWALYLSQDYREATQNVETDITLRSTPTLRKKGQPCYFDLVTFRGADPGTALTLLADTTIRPIFFVNPMVGSTVTLSELLAHEQTQITLFEALAHMHNLRIYTDELSRTIYIEPQFMFLNGNKEIDWTDKIDRSKPIVTEEMGAGRNRTEAYLYTDEDGSVMRWNEDNKKKFARWETSIKNAYAKTKEKKFINPFFAPSLDVAGTFPQAFSASLIKAGDRDRSAGSSDDGDLNFAPKVVRYLGMRNLPDGESWGWPSYGSQYPLVMFHSDKSDYFTLCFDDYEGQLGLNNYYKPEYEVVNNGKRVTLFLNLTPSDMEAILYPNSLHHDFRGQFVFRIRGEKIRCRLFEVADYDPSRQKSTRCVFIKEP